MKNLKRILLLIFISLFGPLTLLVSSVTHAELPQLKHLKSALLAYQNKDFEQAKREMARLGDIRLATKNLALAPYIYYYKAEIPLRALEARKVPIKAGSQLRFQVYEEAYKALKHIDLTMWERLDRGFPVRVKKLRLKVLSALLEEERLSKGRKQRLHATYERIKDLSEEYAFLNNGMLSAEELSAYLEALRSLKLKTMAEQIERGMTLKGQWKTSLLSPRHPDLDRVEAMRTSIDSWSANDCEWVMDLFSKMKFIDEGSTGGGATRFNFITRRYLDLKVKNDLNSKESAFVSEFEDHFSDFHPDFVYSIIESLWNRRLIDDAISIAESLARKNTSYARLPDLHFNLGRMYEDKKNYSKARKYFALVIEESFMGKYYENALFRLPWVMYLDEANIKDTIAAFESYLAIFPKGDFESASKYFLLKLYEKDKRPSAFIADKKAQLANESKIGFYTLYMLNKEGRDYPFSSLFNLTYDEKKVESILGTSVTTQYWLQLVKEMLEVGLNDAAIEILNGVAENEENIYWLYLLANRLPDSKINKKTILMTRTFNLVEDAGQTLSLKQIFPLRYLEEIKAALKRFNLNYDPYLILSLMRQESVFDSEITSGSNARGLMQVIDATAAAVARNAGIQRYDLYNPKDNITLGVLTFDREMKAFGGKIHLVLAAYNAGPEAVARWIYYRGHLPTLEFIESIPYKETRGYVKSILRNYFFYKMLYEKMPLGKIPCCD